jgi:hypothetical protein
MVALTLVTAHELSVRITAKGQPFGPGARIGMQIFGGFGRDSGAIIVDNA